MSAKKMEQALRRIAEWDECTPEFRVNFDSNGERDHYRTIAREALAEHEAQARAVPDGVRSTIGKLLADAMNVSVANGANSVSMPDEYVELAAWLAAAPQPDPEQEDWVRFWLRAALRCPSFNWDKDQREMAEAALAAAQQLRDKK